MVTGLAQHCPGVAEHLHRYALALEIVKGKAVLDIACGEGYGSALLAEIAESVVGVDIDQATVEHAQRKYRRENLNFIRGSCLAIPIPDASVDVVVSFETLEHFAEHAIFIREAKRVLRPGGLLLISTPNRPEFSERTGVRWEYHVKELDEREFKDLLGPAFRNVQILSQRLVYGSAIFSSPPVRSIEAGVYEGDFGRVSFSPDGTPPRFYLALCSDSPLPEVRLSIFQSPLPQGIEIMQVADILNSRLPPRGMRWVLGGLAGKAKRLVKRALGLRR